MKTLILSTADIKGMINHIGLDCMMSEMIHRLTQAFQSFDKQQTQVPPRSGFEYTQPDYGLLEWMPTREAGKTVTVKMVGYHPTNPQLRNLPTVLSSIGVYDTTSGHLIALADATFTTALRTGATSAVASQFMASPDSSKIGLIGAGAQGLTQLHALAQIFSIDEVFVYDCDPRVTKSFLDRAAFMGLNLVPFADNRLNQLVSGSDIICTATSVDIGQGPVFENHTTKPWLHINGIGADSAGKWELPLALLKRSFVCPDFIEQAIKEGECQHLAPEEIAPDLIEVIQNQHNYLFVQQQLSVFDSTGWALEDKVAVEMLIDYAKDLNLGTFIQLESISEDPLNPYQFTTVSDDFPESSDAIITPRSLTKEYLNLETTSQIPF